jgi:glycosyltransferase involved in cell wall biosynthesis
VCVCDNGSTDGTAEALREVEEELDVPHRFLFNDRNRGNSIARNQIIDVALELGADYLLFVDGDIELVPFSSAAMLRYCEDHGPRLGCLGADFATCTPIRSAAATSMITVGAVQDVDLVAWTQYGFRCDVFRDGVRFDEALDSTKTFADTHLASKVEIGSLQRMLTDTRRRERNISSPGAVPLHRITRLFRLALLTLGFCGLAAIAYLGRSNSLSENRVPNGTQAAPAPAYQESFANRLRRTIRRLDTITTAKGALFWPGGDDICGLPPR